MPQLVVRGVDRGAAAANDLVLGLFVARSILSRVGAEGFRKPVRRKW